MTFKLSKQALTILEKRYFKDGEDWEGLCKRVAKAIAHDNTQEKEFFDIMVAALFLPNTPCLVNAGRTNKNLSACFVLPLEDSMESIFKTLADSAQVYKEGGGCGINFSTLRPEGSKVKTTNGISSGPISFMKIYDEAIAQIKAGGIRRGAAIGLLSIYHPDIVKFIKSKSTNKELTNFNISVLITDEFMRCLEDEVRTDSPWFCSFGKKVYKIRKKDDQPVDVDVVSDKDKPFYTVQDIYKLIVDCCWKSGDPGLIFIDEIQRQNGQQIQAVNPCQPKDSPILDDDGLKRIDSEGVLWDSWKTGIKPIIKALFNNGLEVSCTADHEIKLDDGTFRAIENAVGKNIEWGLGKRTAKEIYEKEVLRGFLFGDGFICGGRQGVSVKITDEKEPEVAILLKKYGFYKQPNGAYYTNYKKLSAKLGDLSFLNNRVFDRELPDSVFFGSSNLVASFLKGVFSANGSCSIIGMLCLKGTCHSYIKKVQILLASFGIPSWICKNKKRLIKWHNGEYTSRISYNLQIARSNAYKFKKKIGFVHASKMNRIYKTSHVYATKLRIVEIQQLGEQEVWDYRMKKAPNYNFCQGVILANCGESPLEPYEACVLGSIDMSKFVTEDKIIDYVKLRPVIYTAIDFLNNVIDVGKFPLKEIEDKVKENRKVGLGIMGWADVLIKMEIKYTSNEALVLAEHLMEFVYQTAKEHSEKFGYKNEALTAIAPTGSLSILASCSSGIEPNFNWKIITNRKDFGKQETVHPLAKSCLDKNEKLPDYFITAHELNYEDHVAMQATFQNNGVDLGVSKTINIPEQASKKEIYEAFKLAWKMKCKGVTVYRDKCKTEQVLNIPKKENKLDQNPPLEQEVKQPDLVKEEALNKDDKRQSNIRKRPKVLFGATIKINTSSGPAYITLNEDVEGLRECLVSASKAGSEVGVHTAVEGRLISNSLQYRVPIESIIQHLKNQKSSPIWESGETVKSLPDAIAKAIEFYRKNYEGFSEYLPDDVIEAIKEEKALDEPSGELCPECGENLYMEGGCDVCKSCGFSTCA